MLRSSLTAFARARLIVAKHVCQQRWVDMLQCPVVCAGNGLGVSGRKLSSRLLVLPRLGSECTVLFLSFEFMNPALEIYSLPPLLKSPDYATYCESG